MTEQELAERYTAAWKTLTALIDLSCQRADAVVNAANPDISHY